MSPLAQSFRNKPFAVLRSVLSSLVLIRQREHKPDSVSVTPEKSQVHIELLSGHCLDSASRTARESRSKTPSTRSSRTEIQRGTRSTLLSKLSVSLRRTKREKCTDWLPLRPRSRKPRELDLSTGKANPHSMLLAQMSTGSVSAQRLPLLLLKSTTDAPFRRVRRRGLDILVEACVQGASVVLLRRSKGSL
jgi:hypothetical protein